MICSIRLSRVFGSSGVLELVVVEITGVVGVFWGIELGNWDFLTLPPGVGFILNEKKKSFNFFQKLHEFFKKLCFIYSEITVIVPTIKLILKFLS